MLRCRILLALTAVLLLAAKAPSTRRQPVTDTYHGVAVKDDYRWLEDADAPAVKQWVARQNRASRAYLDSAPARAALEKRLGELYRARRPPMPRRPGAADGSSS